MDNDRWLERLAAAPDMTVRAQLYDQWAPTYDQDMVAIGYTNHAVAAALLARHVAVSSPVLDAGVGTGALGEILTALGYQHLTGIDMSDGMLVEASRRATYAELRKQVLGESLCFRDNTFAASVAFGVLALGHAPPSSLDELVRVTRPGGSIIFSVGSAAWDNGGFKEKLAALEANGQWTRMDLAGPYHPMPYSVARRDFTNRAFVYRVA